MKDSKYIHLSHNVSNFDCYIVFLAKYYLIIFDEIMEEHLKKYILG